MKEGDCYDIVELLSTAERDFLVCNNGDQVKIESLRGKAICIYLLYSLRAGVNQDVFMTLAEAYNEQSPKGEFEVVVVPARGVFSPKYKKRKIDLTEKIERDIKYQELLKNIFSVMPWLSIPDCDVKTRERLCYFFSGPPFFPSECIFLDPDGKVVWPFGRGILRNYGAEGYPFTLERIQEIEKEDELLRGNLCLKTLLGSSTSDFLINNKEDKVPISQLKGKVVGLYMYDGESGIKKSILAAYKELTREGKNFEIVLVNLHFNGGCSENKKFWKNFKSMPWLALPFMDKRCRKLWRIFGNPCVGYDDGGILLIFGPDGSFVETYGYSILTFRGIEAYPFTKERVMEMEKKRREKVTLDRIFAKAAKDYVIKNDGTKISMSDLKGMNILLFSPDCESKYSCEVLPKLIEWYYEIQAKDATFEIIYFSSPCSQVSFNEFFSKMPWLAFPWDSHNQLKSSDMLGGYVSELAAFGIDGHLITIEALPRLKDHGVDAYPFAEDKVSKLIFEEFLLPGVWFDDKDWNWYQ